MNRRQSARSRTNHRRGGYVLVLVATLLFGLFATAALVIDLGFARLAQARMQTAADSAALEGLRGQGITSYQDRQAAAQRFIAWTLDDDLDASNGDAGPVNNDQFEVAIQRGGTVLEPYDLLSEGPSVPYLFARGSLLNRGAIGDGISTGGVAKAISEKALSVGLPVNDAAGNLIHPGAIAIGYALADWNGTRSDPRQVDSAKTRVGQPVVNNGPTTLANGCCCIFDDIAGVERVVGFGMIHDGTALPAVVAVANAVGRQGSVWNQIDPNIRNEVLTRNAMITGGLLVAHLAPRT